MRWGAVSWMYLHSRAVQLSPLSNFSALKASEARSDLSGERLGCPRLRRSEETADWFFCMRRVTASYSCPADFHAVLAGAQQTPRMTGYLVTPLNRCMRHPNSFHREPCANWRPVSFLQIDQGLNKKRRPFCWQAALRLPLGLASVDSACHWLGWC